MKRLTFKAQWKLLRALIKCKSGTNLDLCNDFIVEGQLWSCSKHVIQTRLWRSGVSSVHDSQYHKEAIRVMATLIAVWTLAGQCGLLADETCWSTPTCWWTWTNSGPLLQPLSSSASSFFRFCLQTAAKDSLSLASRSAKERNKGCNKFWKWDRR